MEKPDETQATRLRDAVTDDHVRAMLMTDRGSDAKLISWKIRDFTEDDNNISCFVVSIDVKYSEEEKEQITCYALKLDPSYLSEIFDDFTEDSSDEDTSADFSVDSTTTPVYFSLGGLEESQTTAPLDFITDGLIRSALKEDQGNNVRLLSWEIPNYSKKSDIMTSHFATVDVIFRGKSSIQNTSYVVKYNPGCHEKQTNEVARITSLNEIKFYMNVGPELSSVLQSICLDALRFPKCFYANEKLGKEMVFLEDLKLKGFRKLNLWKGMDIDHATLIIKELARFHASSILLQKKNPEGVVSLGFNTLEENSLLSISKGHVNDMLSMGVKCTVKILNHRSGYSKAIGWLTRHKSRLYHIFEKMLQSSPPFDVICHGNCWDENTLFRYDDKDNPIETMLINLQWSRVASLATDLSSFLLSSLDGGSRRQGRDVLLRIYFQTLKGVLEAGDESSPFSLEELLQEYKNKQLFGVVNALTFIPFAVQDEASILNFQSVQDTEVKEEGEEERGAEEDEEEERVEEEQSLVSPDEHLSFKRIFALFDELEDEGLLNADFIDTGH